MSACFLTSMVGLGQNRQSLLQMNSHCQRISTMSKPGVSGGQLSRSTNPLAPLAQKLTDEGLVFACAFDCDADRMEIVLPLASEFTKRQGSPVVSGQYVLGLVTKAILETRPDVRGLPIITNDATSQLVQAVPAVRRSRGRSGSGGDERGHAYGSTRQHYRR